MIRRRLQVTLVGLVAALVDSAVVAEFAAHWLGRTLNVPRRIANRGTFMDTNSSTGLRVFDRNSRASPKLHHPFNGTGYQATIQHYESEDAELLSLRGCSRALFCKSDFR
jgi:hypothetical protein